MKPSGADGFPRSTQIVTVTGVDDPAFDGSVPYTIVLGPATSGDPAFSGFNPSDVAAVNDDDEKVPELERVWGGCGLTGLEVLALLALWRRLRRASCT